MIWVNLAFGAVDGTKITAFCPCAAQMPASEEPAFPVEAATMVSIPFSFAKAETKAEALSLNEKVGF